MDLGLSVMGKKPVLVLFTCFHCILSHSVLMRVWHLLRFIPLCSFFAGCCPARSNCKRMPIKNCFGCAFGICCYSPYYPTAGFPSSSSWWTVSGLAKSHAMLTCTNGVLPCVRACVSEWEWFSHGRWYDPHERQQILLPGKLPVEHSRNGRRHHGKNSQGLHSKVAPRAKITLHGNTNKSLLRTDCRNPLTVAWEVKTSNRSRVRRDHPCCHRAIWICKCGHARDAIMYAMWRRNLYGSSGSTGGRKLPFSSTLALHKPWQNGDDDDDDDETNSKLLLWMAR